MDACIRHSKAKNWSEALWWAERGIELYGDRAIDGEWVDDLQSRAFGDTPAPRPAAHVRTRRRAEQRQAGRERVL